MEERERERARSLIIQQELYNFDVFHCFRVAFFVVIFIFHLGSFALSEGTEGLTSSMKRALEPLKQSDINSQFTTHFPAPLLPQLSRIKVSEAIISLISMQNTYWNDDIISSESLRHIESTIESSITSRRGNNG